MVHFLVWSDTGAEADVALPFVGIVSELSWSRNDCPFSTKASCTSAGEGGWEGGLIGYNDKD